MGKTSLPPGFRFHPTDLELSVYYLKRKIMGKPFRFEAISEIELYKFAPWDLPDKSCLQSNDREWYFFCPGDRKYSNSSRKNRATDNGYWKTTGKDRPISYNSRIVARKKTLIFHVGKVPQGERTDWVMHEYRLEDKELVDAGFFLDAYVLCRIFEKSGRGPKIGEQYGALFREEDWEDEVNDSSVLVPPTCDGSMNVQHQFSDQVLQSDSIAMDGIPPGSPEYVNVNRLLQELSENNNNELFVAQDGEMADPLILHGGSTYGNETHNSLETHSSQVELEPADDIYFSNDIEHALEHDLLDLSGQALPRSITDIYSLSNSGNENILHLTLLGVGDGSYMEMRDFQFPVEAHFPEFAVPENLFGYCPSFQNLSSVTHVNDIHDGSLGTIYP